MSQRHRPMLWSVAWVAVLGLSCAGAPPLPWAHLFEMVKQGGVFAAAATAILALVALLWRHVLKRPAKYFWDKLAVFLEIDAWLAARAERRKAEMTHSVELAIGPRLTRIELATCDVNNWKAFSYMTAVDAHEARAAIYQVLDRDGISHAALGPAPSFDMIQRGGGR